jgi:alcohol dehydrogenase
MQQLTYLGAGKLEWREAPEPVLEGPAQALVRPVAVAACDLDAAIVRGRAPFAPPFPLGHEAVASVVAVGEGVSLWKPGDLVAVPFQPSCGTCWMCARGLTSNCESVPRTSMYGIGAAGGDWGGAFADLMRIPYADHMLVRLPEGVSPAAAASAGDNVADAWRTVGPPLSERPRTPVLVLGGAGAGSIGLYATHVALALGAERVDYHDLDERRVEAARRLGANATRVDRWPERLGSYPITVEACQDPAGLACALRSTEPWGTCTSTSIYFEGMTPVPLTEMYMKGISFVTGRVPSRTVLPEVLRLIETQKIKPELITTETASWSDAPSALLGYTTKLVVVRQD